jgi:nitroreductase
MELKQVMGNRRSIRYFEPDKAVEKEKIQIMLEAMNRASRAIQADFVKGIVAYRDELDPDVVEQLKTPTTTADIDLAPVHIFFYLDMNYIEGAQGRLKELVDLGALNPSHGWSHAYVDEVVWATVLKPMSADPGVVAYIGAIDAGVAICQAMLAAVDEGLGVCLHAFNTEVAKKAFGVPDTWLPLHLLLVGYPAEDPLTGGQRPRRPLSSQFFLGSLDQPWEEIPEVTDQLKRDGLIQEGVDAAKRRAEVRQLAQRFGLPE